MTSLMTVAFAVFSLPIRIETDLFARTLVYELVFNLPIRLKPLAFQTLRQKHLVLVYLRN